MAICTQGLEEKKRQALSQSLDSAMDEMQTVSPLRVTANRRTRMVGSETSKLLHPLVGRSGEASRREGQGGKARLGEHGCCVERRRMGGEGDREGRGRLLGVESNNNASLRCAL